MRSSRWFGSVPALLLVAVVLPLRADVIATTFGPGMTFDPGATNAWSIVSDQWIGSFFHPNMAASLDTVDVAVRIDGTFLYLDIVQNNSGVPGPIIETLQLTGTALSPTLRTATSSLHPLLTPAAAYWLVLRPGDGTGGWFWNNQGNQGFAFTPNQGATWFTNGQVTPAFDVNGTPTTVTPEPQYAGLLVAALIGLVVARRRYRHAA